MVYGWTSFPSCLITESNTAVLAVVFTVLFVMKLLVGRQEGHPACQKLEWWGGGMVICLERGADLHMSQLMPLPLTVSCSSKIQSGFTFLVSAHLGSPGKGPLNVCVCVCVSVMMMMMMMMMMVMTCLRVSSSVTTREVSCFFCNYCPMPVSLCV